MSYSSIFTCVYDVAFQGRVTSCVAQEQSIRGLKPEPLSVVEAFRWAVASANDVEAAYAYALDAGTPNPGGDRQVISDQMILSHVQANWDVIIPPPPA